MSFSIANTLARQAVKQGIVLKNWKVHGKIAHRLNTIVHADKILVLDSGRIIQEGNHGRLMSEDGLYSLLRQEQQKARGWKFGTVYN